MSQCYAPNAIPIPQYGPCNTSNSISLCCTPGQICLTNGLCANGQGEFYSGACTDKTYKAAICPSFCTGANKFVVQCEDAMVPDGGFCCDFNGSGTCCGTASNALDLASAVSSAVVASIASKPQMASTAGPIQTSANNSPGIKTTEATSTHLIASTITSTLISVSPTTTPTTPPSSTDATSRKIGLGIGIPIGSLLALILAIFCIKKLRKRRSEPQPQASIPNSGVGQAEKSDPSVHELDSMPSPMPELAPAHVEGKSAP